MPAGGLSYFNSWLTPQVAPPSERLVALLALSEDRIVLGDYDDSTNAACRASHERESNRESCLAFTCYEIPRKHPSTTHEEWKGDDWLHCEKHMDRMSRCMLIKLGLNE
ncbi:hypothetical protein ACVINW_003734 [Bradyrhizobium sp. USDA 4461]